MNCAGFQRRRRDIFVARGHPDFPSPVGATSSVRPPLMSLLRSLGLICRRCYNDAAPPVLAAVGDDVRSRFGKLHLPPGRLLTAAPTKHLAVRRV